MSARRPSGWRGELGDAGVIVAARGVRAFGYGALAVTLGVALLARGLALVQIGALITVSLAGDFCGTYLIALEADRWGRRRTLMALALVMALTGALFATVGAYPVLLAAAFFGTLGTSGSETAPFLPIEQAMLPQTAPVATRTALFARYNLVASAASALGALAAGGIGGAFAHRPEGGYALVFALYIAAALVTALLAWRLSPRVEAQSVATREEGWRRLVPPLRRSRGAVLRLAALFSVDALAGGLVVQSLLALYFHLRFGVALASLGALFFGANLLAALSFLAAPALARRFGLLNTMVFTHLPSNALLVLVALLPSFPLAGGALLLRQLLSQMDVPTRQAYTMALVAPEERSAAAAVTSLARSAGSAASPV
ncbi:MAG TPA: MFS transporter, partial [Ktedonobacterales bacterium]|nr:MFS transporter [Ktedonobacterales bacterium]